MSDNPTHGDEDPGFLDAASGIPMSRHTRQALSTACRVGWANPRKRYPAAAVARRMLEQSRASVAQIMSCRAEEVVFLSGSPDDSIALAMRAGVAALVESGEGDNEVRLMISDVEELRVLRAAESLIAMPPHGSRIRLIQLPVDGTGLVSCDAVMESSGDGPSVVVLQAANGELGTRQPLDAVAKALPEQARLIVDGRYHVGRCPLPLPGDFVVADPTIWGGPPGISVLVARGLTSLAGLPAPTSGPLGIESTNPPVPLVAAAALSLESATATAWTDRQSSLEMTRLLRDLVKTQINDVQVLGHPENQLGYIVMFSFLYVAADELVDELSRLGWSVASGSACTSDTQRPLHVLEAIGALTHGNLRVSLPPWTTEATITTFADDVALTVAQIRADSGAGDL